MARPTLNFSGKSPAPAAPLPDEARILVEKDAVPAAYLGASVVVKLSEKINGQDEYAAIVTRVHGAEHVNVIVFPGSGQPYPVASIYREAGTPSWRWPPRH